MIPERELIALIAAGRAGAPVRRGDVGIGDDCAVVRSGRRAILVTTDLIVEKVHFDLRWVPPYFIGRKAAVASLSDIAAMGGAPRGLFVSAAFPARARGSFARALLEGIHEEARSARTPVLGGDTSSSPGPVVIDVVAVGEAAASGKSRPVLRSGARPGDGVWVSGSLGASALGLSLLRAGCRPWSWKFWSGNLAAKGSRTERRRAALLAIMTHLFPRPRLDLGRRLAGRGLASAMIDLSDGLSTDLHNLCESSGVGARIEESRLPLHPSLAILAPRRALAIAMSGGEDYELLFTVPRRLEPVLERLVPSLPQPVRRIGRIAAGSGGIVLIGRRGVARRLRRTGYEHFKG